MDMRLLETMSTVTCREIEMKSEGIENCFMKKIWLEMDFTMSWFSENKGNESIVIPQDNSQNCIWGSLHTFPEFSSYSKSKNIGFEKSYNLLSFVSLWCFSKNYFSKELVFLFASFNTKAHSGNHVGSCCSCLAALALEGVLWRSKEPLVWCPHSPHSFYALHKGPFHFGLCSHTKNKVGSSKTRDVCALVYVFYYVCSSTN